jgi:antitoxin component YwqK of YwqJK toxin-antitoxin module
MSIQVEDLSRVLLCAALLLPACGDGDGQAEGEPSLTTTWHDQGAGIKQSEGDLVYGRKVGEWTWWHPNGQVAVRGSFEILERDGVSTSEEVGQWDEWHPNGQKKSERVWVEGRADGQVQEWHDNGKLSRESVYVNGRAEGDSTTYYPGGEISNKSSYKAGRLDGASTSYWGTGEEKVSGQWESGAQVGLWRAWHPNGQLRSEEPFDGGVLSGTVKTWFGSGSPESETVWDGGEVRSGKVWYESGGLREAGASRDGLSEAWYEGGVVKMRGELSGGVRTGPWQFFHENGALNQEMSGVYEAGNRTGPL